MLIEIIKTIKPNSLDNQDFYNIDDLLDKIKIRLYNNIKKYYPILTTEPLIPSILDSQFKKKYQREIGTTDLLNQSHSKPATIKKKSLIEQLTKDNASVLDEIVKYYQLPKIPLSLNSLYMVE
ncbi:hypothetical protein C1645_827707 [Glomus cerebriforme]|uniref:Uncharacterized protein n=1 Tax=Glomus cerebriforme TaxID=658196 RepID=A0A397SMR5_9GLOM|nr:hypothetical protein C1645_827707 [Glomus cerebriforme]